MYGSVIIRILKVDRAGERALWQSCAAGDRSITAPNLTADWCRGKSRYSELIMGADFLALIAVFSFRFRSNYMGAAKGQSQWSL